MTSCALWYENDDTLVRELLLGQRAYAPPRIAGYDDLKELRRGGQGIVFVGRQVSTRRQVAIKIVLDGAMATREARRRFEREIGLVATLRHPNIVRVYDSGETGDGRLYYIMEYIDGVGLDEFMSDASLNGAFDFKSLFPQSNDVLTMFAKICDGVQYAHQQGVIHRDLKPSNVRIDRAGEPHVLDFGLAKLATPGPDATQVSQPGGFMGSLPWASPEHAEGSGALIDIRSDVYSLGVILYQLAAGAFPYRVDAPLREVLQNIQQAVPRSPCDVRPGVSDDVATIALKCLSKEPERRYQSAGDLARDVRHYLAGEPIEAKRDSAWYSVRMTLKRYKTTVRLIGASLVLSILFSIGMAFLWARAVRAERLAGSRLAAAQAAQSAEATARRATENQIEKTRNLAGFLDSTIRAVDPWKHPGRDIGPLREMLDAATERLRGSFTDQPEVEAALAGTLGWDYWTLGLYDPAEKLLRRSFDLYGRTLGSQNEKTLEAQNNLATMLTDQGKYDESAELLRRYLEIQRHLSGPEAPATLKGMNSLALDLDWQGHGAEAEALYRTALEGQTRLLGRSNLDRLSTLNNLAACLQGTGKGDESERLYADLIEGHIAAHGADHPETLQARMNHAQFVNTSGRAAEAEKLFRDILAAIESKLGPQHPLTIVTMNNLASAVSSLGRLDEGLALSRKAYEAQVAFAGPDHPSTLVRKMEFVATLIELHRWAEAIPLARELVAQDTKVFGANDWRTLIVAGNLGFALKQVGQVEEAEATWKLIIDTPNVEAGQGSEPIITAQANLAALYADQKRWSEAETAFRMAIAAQVGRKEQDHWRTAYMRCGLGHVLLETDRVREAEAELRPGYDRLAATLGDKHEKTQRAIGYLVRLYEKNGNSVAAESFRTKLTTN